MYFNECPYCGASLDPGEKCDCQEEKEQKRKRIEESLPQFKVEKGGQLIWCDLELVS